MSGVGKPNSLILLLYVRYKDGTPPPQDDKVPANLKKNYKY